MTDRLLVVVLLFAALALPSAGQQYRFREYRQLDGLENLATTALYQDRRDYLWVGTQNGLYRYDGTRFVRYGEKEGLAGAFIMAIGESPDGTLWVSASHGLARWEADHFETDLGYLEAAELPGMGLAIAKDGTLFAAKPGGLVVGRLSGAKKTYVFHDALLPREARTKTIFQVAVDGNSKAWFGCGTGLCRTDASWQVEVFQNELGIPEDRWDGIAIDAEGTMWLRSPTRLLRRKAGETRFELIAGVGRAHDQALLFSLKNGELFVPQEGGLGILRPGTAKWQEVENSNGLPGEQVTSALLDHEGNVWVGFIGDGIARWLGYGEWEGWTKQQGLNSNTVWLTMRDGDGQLWAATDSGINWFDEGSQRWKSLGGEEGKRLGRVMSMAKDRTGRLWAASQSEGLVRIDPRRHRYELLGKAKLAGAQTIEYLEGIHLDREDRLWLGTSEGLYVAELSRPLNWVPTGHADGPVRTETVFSISEDSAGRIWAAGNHGVQVLWNGLWRRWGKAEGLLSAATWYAREGKPGTIWVGYLDSVGASQIVIEGERARVEHFAVEGKQKEYVQYFSSFDRVGRFWAGTDWGVYVTERGRTVHITDQDGLIWNDCNSNAFFGDADGSVWIGTAKGLAHGRLKRGLEAPVARLRVEAMRVNGKDVDWRERVRVPAVPNSLEVSLSPMTFRHEGRVAIQVRLGDTEDPWMTRRAPTEVFSQIGGGTPRLQARMKVDNFEWSPVLVDLPVEVEARFFQSWRGVGLVVGLVVLLGWLVWRYRTEKLIEDRKVLAMAVEQRTREIKRLLEQAREASRLKSEFLANMSHEIRTPMNGVLGMLQLMEAGPLEAEQRKYMGLARGSAENLLHLLNEILDLSKVESGKLELESAPFDLLEMVRQLDGLFRPMARQKGLQLEMEVGRGIPSRLVGDVARLTQVLMNLVGNAMKFTSEGRVALLVDGRAGAVRFVVEDTGIGIPEDKIETIFDAFRQADGSTTRRYGGTGLGLAISKRLVELMGGRIGLVSRVGEGSRFEFELPLETGSMEVERNVDEILGTRDVDGMRILLAEDNAVNQLVAMKMLERSGHQVELVTDGEQAVERAGKEHFDLILMDVHMPVLDGLEAARAIRRNEEGTGQRTPIVALTAGVFDEEREKCMSAGMDEFLAKPVKERELSQVLGRFGRRVATPVLETGPEQGEPRR